jgi:hypothetical protein
MLDSSPAASLRIGRSRSDMRLSGFAFRAATKMNRRIISTRTEDGLVASPKKICSASQQRQRRLRCRPARQAALLLQAAGVSTLQNEICRRAEVRCCFIPTLLGIHFLTRRIRFRAHIPARSFEASGRNERAAILDDLTPERLVIICWT